MSRQTSSPASTQTRHNRYHLSVALVPFAMIGLLGASSLLQRAAAASAQPSAGYDSFGQMSRQEALNYSTKLCKHFVGNVVVTDVLNQSAYSTHRHHYAHEWNITCAASDGQYLLRINADTRRVYAINRLDNPGDNFSYSPASAASDAASVGTTAPLINRKEAEERAKQYLSMVGVPGRDLVVMMDETSNSLKTSDSHQWNFTFRHRASTFGNHLLKVSINAETGGLQHLWNPVYAL